MLHTMNENCNFWKFLGGGRARPAPIAAKRALFHISGYFQKDTIPAIKLRNVVLNLRAKDSLTG